MNATETGLVFDLLQQECHLPAWLTTQAFYDPAMMLLLAVLAVLTFMIWNRLAPLFFKTAVAAHSSLGRALVAGAVVASLADEPMDRELLGLVRILQRLPNALKESKQAEVRRKKEAAFRAMPDLGAPSPLAPPAEHRSSFSSFWWIKTKGEIVATPNDEEAAKPRAR